MTLTDAQKQFPVRLRRAHVLELGRSVGLSERTIRSMIEGQGAPIKGIIYPNTKRQYFDREQVVQALFQPQATAS